jgi:uncharacterized OB-fold protein
MATNKPTPQIDDDAPFWDAATDHELRMQQCEDCGHIRWPPGPVCPECWAEPHEWTELSGRGEVNTWVVFHRVYFDAFADDVPYNVAEVELEEGPRYLAPVNCENDDLYRGMPVEVYFDDVAEDVTLPKFTPR